LEEQRNIGYSGRTTDNSLVDSNRVTDTYGLQPFGGNLKFNKRAGYASTASAGHLSNSSNAFNTTQAYSRGNGPAHHARQLENISKISELPVNKAQPFKFEFKKFR